MPEPKKWTGARGHTVWRVRFRMDGKQMQESFDTLKEAKAFCSDIESRDARYALRVLHETEAEGTLTLDAIAAQFFDWKESRVRSDRTVADYRRDYANAIKPVLGSRKAGSVLEADVQRWVDGMVGQIAPKTIHDRHALLHQIYAWALHPSQHLADHNPAVGTTLPKKQRTPPKGLHPNEWAALHAAIAQIDADAADLAEFLLATGWRISEAAAVTAWDFEDYGKDGMFVSMAHVMRRNAAGQYVVVDEGKGDASLRRIRLDAEAAEMVRRRLEHVQDGGLVFTTKTGAQWHTDNFRSRIWKPAVKAANLSRKPTPHWLRHTAVFWSAMNGANLADLQARIGHASITTTIGVYGSMIADVSPDVLEKVAAMRHPQLPSGGTGPQGLPASPEHPGTDGATLA